MEEDDEMLSRFALPDYSTLSRGAGTRRESGRFQVIYGGIQTGRNGPIGLHVGVGGRQCGFWLPFDAPDFEEARDLIRTAAHRNEAVGLVLDPDQLVILGVDLPRDAARGP